MSDSGQPIHEGRTPGRAGTDLDAHSGEAVGSAWRPSKPSTEPTSLRGTQALFVVNLEPKRMMGELSEGMLFDIGYADGIRPVLSVPEETVPNGSRAG